VLRQFATYFRVVLLVDTHLDRIHGAWWDRIVPTDAKGAVARSPERYLKAIRR